MIGTECNWTEKTSNKYTHFMTAESERVIDRMKQWGRLMLMLRFCNGKSTFPIQFCTVCWFWNGVWLMPEFSDTAYHWMKSISRLLKYKMVIKDCTAILYKEWRSQRAYTVCVFMCVCAFIYRCTHIIRWWSQSLFTITNNQPGYIYDQNNTPFNCPICKSLCSDRPSQQHFNNLQ